MQYNMLLGAKKQQQQKKNAVPMIMSRPKIELGLN